MNISGAAILNHSGAGLCLEFQSYIRAFYLYAQGGLLEGRNSGKMLPVWTFCDIGNADTVCHF